MFKKLTLAAIILFSASNAQAIEVGSKYCDTVTGDINAEVKITVWDKLFHKKVVIGVKDNYGNKKETRFDIVYPGKTYSANIYELNLPYNVSKYYIGTDKGILFEGPCE